MEDWRVGEGRVLPKLSMHPPTLLTVCLCVTKAHEKERDGTDF
jgi:hypothetical protein